MTIHQLKDRCWELQPPADDDRQSHYHTEADAMQALTEDRDGDPEAYPDTKPVLLDVPCWLVECDGECETALDSEGDGYTFHCPSRQDAEAAARAYDWVVTAGPVSGDELAYCPEDRPGDVPLLPPLPAELEAAGQLVIPGVLP